MQTNNLIKNLTDREETWEKEWTVSKDGDISHKGNEYVIASFRLGAENWIGHMAEKRWVDMNTFIPAYIEACRRAGVTFVQIGY